MERNSGKEVLQSHKLAENDDFQFNEDPYSDTAKTRRLPHMVHILVSILACVGCFICGPFSHTFSTSHQECSAELYEN